MLRFTLHRPSQNSQVSTRCHGMSCRDIPCRVHVGVRLVPARNAHEGRLALATLRCDVLAGVTGLRRVRSFDLLDPSRCFLFQPVHQLSPPRLEDAPVEPCLRSDVPPRVLDGSPSGAGHTLDVEVLDPDHVETPGKVCGGFLDPAVRRSASLAFSPAIRAFTFLRRFDPRRARARRRWSRRSSWHHDGQPGLFDVPRQRRRRPAPPGARH
jgi:hypothetical protein